MPTYFFDSSALVKAYRREAGTSAVEELIAGTGPLIVSRLTHLEVTSAIVRRGRTMDMPQEDIERTLAGFETELSTWFQIIELSEPVLSRASEVTRQYALRAADAVQLACALMAIAGAPAETLVLVSSDQELNSAAAAQGLNVFDPTEASE